MLPLPSVPHVVLWYHLTLPGLDQPVPVSSSSLFMEVIELRLSLYIPVVSLFFSSPLVFEVLFPKVLSGCFSLGKVQVLFYNKGITVFSLSWKSNKRKYLFKIFPAARSQLDTCDSSLSLYTFFQHMSIKCLSPKLFDSKNNSNGLRFLLHLKKLRKQFLAWQKAWEKFKHDLFWVLWSVLIY